MTKSTLHLSKSGLTITPVSLPAGVDDCRSSLFLVPEASLRQHGTNQWRPLGEDQMTDNRYGAYIKLDGAPVGRKRRGDDTLRRGIVV